MLRTIFLFGTIAGLMLAGFGWLTFSLCFNGRISLGQTTAFGYAGMAIALSMVFFGIRSYKNGSGGGSVSFRKALEIGLMITFVASAIHFVGYQAYNAWNPDFREFYYQKFREQMVSKLEKTASQEAIDEIKGQVRMVQTISENPLYGLAFAIITLLPIGLLLSLMSATVLRKRHKSSEVQDITIGE